MSLLEKKFLVYGMGISGVKTAQAIVQSGGIVLCGDDHSIAQQSFPFQYYNEESSIDDVTAVILSPGIPLTHPKPHFIVTKAKKIALPIWCDIELFYRTFHAYSHIHFIAITGTNGKSSVTDMMTFLLNKTGHKAYSCGNIGTAIWDLPYQEIVAADHDIYLCIEVSSYQADLCHDFAPERAVFLNLTPDHIDRHGNIENYFMAKMRLFQHIHKNGIAVISGDSPYHERAREIAQNVAILSKQEKEEIISDLKNMPHLQGAHQQENIFSIAALLKTYHIAPKDFIPFLSEYKGLPHRMEVVAQKNHILFMNDSKATNAEATQKALTSDRSILWIAGGVAKQGGIEQLQNSFDRIEHTYLYGQDQVIFSETLKKNNVPFSCFETLEEAVRAAYYAALPLSKPVTILLSPAAASFDQFKNFAARGDCFKKYVYGLIKENSSA